VCEQGSCIKANCTHAEPIAELWPIARAAKANIKPTAGAQRSIKHTASQFVRHRFKCENKNKLDEKFNFAKYAM
jgi:hypothetical protein